MSWFHQNLRLPIVLLDPLILRLSLQHLILITLHINHSVVVPFNGVCSAWYACLIAAPSGIIPFAVAMHQHLQSF